MVLSWLDCWGKARASKEDTKQMPVIDHIEASSKKKCICEKFNNTHIEVLQKPWGTMNLLGVYETVLWWHLKDIKVTNYGVIINEVSTKCDI